MLMKCAWCGRILETSSASVTSHGICPECKKKFRTPSRNDKSEMDDSLSSRKSGSPRKSNEEEERSEMGFII